MWVTTLKACVAILASLAASTCWLPVRTHSGFKSWPAHIKACSSGSQRVPPQVPSFARCSAYSLPLHSFCFCRRWASLPTDIPSVTLQGRRPPSLAAGAACGSRRLRLVSPFWLRMPQARAGSLCFRTRGSGLGQPTFKRARQARCGFRLRYRPLCDVPLAASLSL